MAQLFNFTTGNIPTQNDETKSFGVKSSNKFRVTSSFDITSNQKTFAIMKGAILLQQQTSDPNKVNLILKPLEIPNLKVPVKYIIYRGLNILDFLTSNNITATTTKVKTSGTELLSAINAIQQDRAPAEDIPVEALFGNDLIPATTKNIDEFFFYNTSPSSQLFTVDGGVELGNYTSGEGGIEIMLHNPEYFIDIESSRKSFFEFDVTGISNPLEKKWNKEQIRHFIDVPAFYGLHSDIDGGIEYRDSSGNSQIANSINLVYEKVLSPFATKNKAYLDIRNENGYSYNYYGNYIGTGGNANFELKTGPDSASLSFKEYYTNEWPIHIVDTISTSANQDYNIFFIALRINDNEKPLLAGVKNILSNAVSPDENQLIKFIDESSLLPSPVPNPLPEFTEPVEILVPNYLSGSSGAQVATIVKLDYIKQIRLRDGNDVFPQENPSDHLFGPITTQIPWNSSDKTQWITSHHFKYFDSINNGFAYGVMEEAITAINPSLKTIKIGVDVANQITNKLEIINASNSDNVGEYNVIKVENTGANETTITVRETLNTLQTGDKLKFKIEVAVSINYIEKKIIAEDIDLSGISAFSTGKKVWLYTKKGDLPKRYSISSRTFGSGDTTIIVSETIDKEGYGAIVQTGIVAESDAINGNRVLLYAAPRYYFKKTGIKDTSFFNYQGATHDEDSFFKTLQERIPGFKLEKYSLQPQTGQFVATLAYPEETVAKENLLFLGLSQTELDSLKTAANNQLSFYHIQMLKLIPQGNRLRDEDYEPYYKYHAVIAGLDSSGDYAETTAYKEIYTRDGLIFTSPEYADHIIADLSPDLDLEEKFHLNLTTDSPPGEWNKIQKSSHPNSTFKYLYETLGVDLKTIVDDFKTEIENLTTANFKSKIEEKIKDKGTELLDTALTNIKNSSGPMYNKDGALYLARLQMRKLIKQHPLVSASFVSYDDVQQYLDLLEKVTRGLHSSNRPDFSSHPAHIPILISGYDPFRAAFPYPDSGLDKDYHLSNPSGNVALSLNNEVITNGSVNAIIKAVIFPVRFREFNMGWIEDFFEQYINSNHSSYQEVKMIVTFSFGGAQYFNIDRFSSRFRDPNNPDNNKINGGESAYLLQSNKDAFEFIETMLPYQSFVSADPIRVALHQKAWATYYNENTKLVPDRELFDNLNLSPLNNFPDITSYPPSIFGITADKLKAREGSGGDYLSNEIYYRVSFLREKHNPDLKTGHIHVGFNRPYVSASERDQMVGYMIDVLEEVILNLE